MNKQAVVIGCGIAGLMATRVLSDHFDHVVVCDRDSLPEEPLTRSSVPQGHHLHVLLPGGWEVLTSYLPELEDTLNQMGGITAGPSEWYALTSHGRTYRTSRFQPTPLVGRQPMRVQSRALLEHCIRQCVLRLPNVTIHPNLKVTQPQIDGPNVRGVLLEDGTKVEAELVIDASGRVSRTLGWLGSMGYKLPVENKIECDFAYASCLFKPTNDDLGAVGFLTASSNTGRYPNRAGAIARIENGIWLVMLSGRLGDLPPADYQEFMGFARSLPDDTLWTHLRGAEPLGVPRKYKFPKSVNRRFDALSDFPNGLLPIGDAICQLNPAYSQGMSVAVCQADALGKLVSELGTDSKGLTQLRKAYFAETQEVIRAPWLFAALRDFSKQGTVGDFPDDEAAAISEIKRVTKLADRGDQTAADLIDSIFDMQRPLRDIFLFDTLRETVDEDSRRL